MARVAQVKNGHPPKTRTSCGRPFEWRAKWDAVWDEVATAATGAGARGALPSEQTSWTLRAQATRTCREQFLAGLADQPPGSAAAIAKVLDALGGYIAYLYFGNTDLRDPVIVVERPVHCQPLNV